MTGHPSQVELRLLLFSYVTGVDIGVMTCRNLKDFRVNYVKQISGQFKYTKKLELSKFSIAHKRKKDLIQHSKVLRKHSRCSWLNRYLIKNETKNYAVSIATNMKGGKNHFHFFILHAKLGLTLMYSAITIWMIYVEVLQFIVTPLSHRS